MMASGNFTVTSSNKYVSCICWWSSSPNTNENYSDVSFELRASRTNSGYTTYGSGSGSVTINGTPIPFSIASSQKITQNSNTLLGSGTVRVYHNDDGSKSIAISAYASIPGAGLTLGTTSATVALDTIARASVPTLNANIFTITMKNENFMRIYTNRKSEDFTHHIYYSLNGSSEIGITSGVEEYYDWYFPDTLANIISDTAVASGYIRLYTFNNGTNIGSKTVSFKMQTSDEFEPTITLEITDAERHLENYGKYIQGKSKIKVVILGEGCYGATIKSYKTTFENKTYSGSEVITDAIVNDKTQTISISVTDSREKTVVIEKEIEIYAYTPPKITAIKVKRCAEDGKGSLQGDYFNICFSGEVTSLDEKNPVTYSVEYKNVSESVYEKVILEGFSNQHNVVDGSYILAAQKEAYSMIFTITDGFGYVQKKATGPSKSVLLSRLWRGLGYAIGKFAELEGVFDIGFKTRFYGGLLRMVLEDEIDLNEVKVPNTYAGRDIETARYVNCPEGLTGRFTLLVEDAGGNGELYQRLTLCNKEKSIVYERFFYDESWGEWIKPYVEPIAEEGQDGDWYYIKRSNGIAECWREKYYGSVAINNAWGAIYESVELPSISFPTGLFIEKPMVCNVSKSGGQGVFYVELGGPTLTGTSGLWLWRPTSTTILNAAISIHAIGKWK